MLCHIYIIKKYGGGYQVLWVFLMFLFVWFLPNSDQISTLLNSNRIEIKENNIFNILGKTQFIKTNIDYLLAIIISTILIVITIKIIEGKQGLYIFNFKNFFSYYYFFFFLILLFILGSELIIRNLLFIKKIIMN